MDSEKGLKPETLYSFSSQEILVLAKFFRQNQDKIPLELFDFSQFIEKEIYNNLTLDQIGEFFK